MENTKVKDLADNMRKTISRVIVGNENVIELLLTAAFAGGHILLEDRPGTGKTMLAKTLARCIDTEFKRVQFTPDLMPTDITGLNIFNPKNGEFRFVPGPVFAGVLLADEINRATPRTQAGLLEAMEERQVTIDGDSKRLSDAFFVVATENPYFTAGTYPLPEASLDRFLMKLSMQTMTKSDEVEVLSRFQTVNPFESIEAVCTQAEFIEAQQEVNSIFVHPTLKEYIVDIVLHTRNSDMISVGVSTRGTLALMKASMAHAAICGRKFVEPDDVRAVAPNVLAHRIITFGSTENFEKNMELIRTLVAGVEIPFENWEK